MNAKNKILAIVEIAIMLCSVLFLAIPAVAADQNQTTQEVSATASEDDYVLGIYGNANEDDTIDMRDVTYTKLVIFGKKPETELADAYYDGEVDVLDVVQIKLIILGRESELTFVDARGEDVTVSMPLERMVILNPDAAKAIRALGAKDRIVGVTGSMVDNPTFYPELSEKPSVGSSFSPDVEAIIALEPDVVFTYGSWPSPEKLDDLLPSFIGVIRLEFYKAETLRGEMHMLGYLLGEVENADEYLKWHDEYVDEIEERVSVIPDEEKTTVFTEGGGGKEIGRRVYAEGTGMYDLSVKAGGKNIAAEF